MKISTISANIIMATTAIISTVFAPWWITVVVLIIGLITTKNPWMILILAAIGDILYYQPQFIFWHIPFITTIIIAIVIAIFMYIKPQ